MNFQDEDFEDDIKGALFIAAVLAIVAIALAIGSRDIKTALRKARAAQQERHEVSAWR